MKHVLKKKITSSAASVSALFEKPHPVFAVLIKLQPILALGTGVLFMLFLRRGFEYIPVIIFFITAAAFFIIYRIYSLTERPRSIAHKASFFAEQFLINNILLFIFPFYIESTTFPSVNIVFAAVIGGMTILVNWFTLYRRWIISSPAAGAIYYASTLFAALNFILPVIIGLNNSLSLLVSSSAAGILTALFLLPVKPGIRRPENIIRITAGLAAAVALIWLFKIIIPPAPLRLISWSACREIKNYAAVDPFTSVRASTSDEIYFLSNIFAPKGLKENIEHLWTHEGRPLFSIDLKEIRGGKRSGFATWSKHRLIEGPGRYCVKVKTKAGQLIGRGCFTVYQKTEGEDGNKPDQAKERGL